MPPPHPAILVVEDEAPTRDLLSDVLELAGYTVVAAPDGPTARRALEAGDIELILLDRMLPDMDGLELCEQVRAHEGDVYLPIIMLTAMAGDAHRHEGFAAGADDYLTKPFRTQELLDRVHVWLRTRQRLKAAHQPPAAPAPAARPGGEKTVSLEEAVERHEAWVEDLIAEAAERPAFLASLLVPYARAQGWDAAALAAAVGCPRASIARLLLRPRPLPQTWEADVVEIAEMCLANPPALARVVRAAEVWEAQGHAGTGPRLIR